VDKVETAKENNMVCLQTHSVDAADVLINYPLDFETNGMHSEMVEDFVSRYLTHPHVRGKGRIEKNTKIWEINTDFDDEPVGGYLEFPNVLLLFDWWLKVGKSLPMKDLHQHSMRNWNETGWMLDRALSIGMESGDDIPFDETGKVRKEYLIFISDWVGRASPVYRASLPNLISLLHFTYQLCVFNF
jgi:hypothetical protein